MSELYVYYRLARHRRLEALAEVQQRFDRLQAQQPGLQARLLRRPPADAPQEEETWMEVYFHAAGVDTLLQDRIESAAGDGPPGRVGARHVERFEPVSLARPD